MSLKAFHVIFISASALLAFGFGAWMLRAHADDGTTGDLVYGVASLGVGLGLVVYEAFVIRKLKNVSYL